MTEASGRRWPALTAVVAMVLVALGVGRVATAGVVSFRATYSNVVRLGGRAPDIAWPTQGQAALAVEGLGSLGAGGSTQPRPIASLTKVMTAYITLRRYPLPATGNGFELTITPAEAEAEAADVTQDQSVVQVAAGEELSERQLLEALLIPSGDNIARILAIYEAGSIPRFVQEMNRTAMALGMTATRYGGPSGYDPDSVSDAGDQLRLFEQAMRCATFRRIVSMQDVTLPVAGTLDNYDPLIAQGYDGKTGSDSQAEGCLAFFHRITVAGHSLTLVGVVLDQGQGADTQAILDAVGDAAERLVDSLLPSIRRHTPLPAHSRVIAIAGPGGGEVNGTTTTALSVIGWGGLEERLTIRSMAGGCSKVRRGQVVGSVSLAGRLPTPAGGSLTTAVRSVDPLQGGGLSCRLKKML